jgi:pSer/pThr/pTyr-binding forkhead associated (FHA) protein
VTRSAPDSETGDDVTRFIGAPHAYGSTIVAWLVHAAGPSRGRDLRLGSGTLRVGSNRECEISLTGDSYISSRHAEIMVERGSVHLRDLQSRNGTFVNGARVRDAALTDGDRIRFGTTEFVFKCVQL